MAPQPLSPALLASTADMINVTSVFIGHGANPEKHQSKLLHIYLVRTFPTNYPDQTLHCPTVLLLVALAVPRRPRTPDHQPT